MGVDDLLGVAAPGAAVEGVRTMARSALALADRTTESALRARRVVGVDWRSVAAEQFREELERSCRQVEACAEGLVSAAAELARHADAADERLAALRSAAEAAIQLGGRAGRAADRVLGAL